VIEAEIDLQQLKSMPPGAIPGLEERLHAGLPGVPSLSPDAGGSSGRHWVHLLIEWSLQLQRQLGCDVHFGTGQEAFRDGLCRVAVEYEEEKLGQACLETARDLCLAAAFDRPFDGDDALSRLRDLAYEVRLGPSTRAIVEAARRRGIPTRRLGDGSLVQLGYGVRQRRILTAETDRTTALAQSIAQDKHLTRALLQGMGVPVPDGRPVADAADAWLAAEELGVPVVIKPQYGNQGRGVATNLTTCEQVASAFAVARKVSSYLMAERHVPGADYRLLVVGDRMVAAAWREPAHVIGNGRLTIAQLVEQVNRDPRRSDGHATCMSRIQLDDISLAVLAEQGCTPDSIPAEGNRVLLRRNGNLSTGGTATDVTDLVHPRVAWCAVQAARVVGLDIAGVDLVATDISRPLEEQGGAVVEVNAGPGLRMHLEPFAGTPRPVGDAIVSLLFPDTKTIPIVAISGVNGKTTTTRLIAHILQTAGNLVGMTCTDGTYMGGRCTEARDCSGPQSARNVLLHPAVEAAVLETARGGVLREGLGFDQCDVAVVTNIGQGDHFGLRGIETLDDLARVKRTVVEAVSATGAAVLNAQDPFVTGMAAYCPGSVIYFARDEREVARASAQRSGRGVFVRDGTVILAGETEEPLLPVAGIPLTHAGAVAFQVENALAAAAAVWALGLPLDTIRAGLTSFRADADHLPGRFNEFHIDGARVVLDYAHNPSAVAALLAALEHFPEQQRTVVFSGCNRRDRDVVAMGALLGDAFDQVILYKDWGHSGRVDGELNRLLRTGLAAGTRVAQVVEAETEGEAINLGLDMLCPGELLVLGVDSLEQAIRMLRARMPSRSENAVLAVERGDQ
jgi:cyanophycin synthetase